jgi:tRNA threonylcarbamoyladenosine biosynthesis protein TsaB
MRVLGIETATRRASVALWENGIAVARAQSEQPAEHAERLLSLIDEAFGAAGWQKGSIDLVACGVGPGSFTGVRVGIATAKGIAMGLDRPIVGVGSLEAMARALRSDAEVVVCILDAKKSEVFLAAYDIRRAVLWGPVHRAAARVAAEMGRFAGKTAVALGEIVATIDPGPVLVHRSPATDLPDAETVALMGAERLIAGGPSELHDLEPTYVRPADVTAPRDAGSSGNL